MALWKECGPIKRSDLLIPSTCKVSDVDWAIISNLFAFYTPGPNDHLRGLRILPAAKIEFRLFKILQKKAR